MSLYLPFPEICEFSHHQDHCKQKWEPKRSKNNKNKKYTFHHLPDASWPVDSDASARPNSGEAGGTASSCLTFTSSSEPGLIASRSCELKLTRRCGFLTGMEPSFGAATQEGPIGALSGLKFREKLLLLAIANLAASAISMLRRCRPDRREPPPDTSDQLRRSSGAQLWCSCSGAQASLGLSGLSGLSAGWDCIHSGLGSLALSTWQRQNNEITEGLSWSGLCWKNLNCSDYLRLATWKLTSRWSTEALPKQHMSHASRGNSLHPSSAPLPWPWASLGQLWVPACVWPPRLGKSFISLAPSLFSFMPMSQWVNVVHSKLQTLQKTLQKTSRITFWNGVMPLCLAWSHLENHSKSAEICMRFLSKICYWGSTSIIQRWPRSICCCWIRWSTRKVGSLLILLRPQRAKPNAEMIGCGGRNGEFPEQSYVSQTLSLWNTWHQRSKIRTPGRLAPRRISGSNRRSGATKPFLSTSIVLSVEAARNWPGAQSIWEAQQRHAQSNRLIQIDSNRVSTVLNS